MCASTRSGRNKCGKDDKSHAFRFFFVENDSNKVVQAGVSLFVVSLQAVFKFGNRDGKVLEENWLLSRCFGWLSWVEFSVLVGLYLTSRL